MSDLQVAVEGVLRDSMNEYEPIPRWAVISLRAAIACSNEDSRTVFFPVSGEDQISWREAEERDRTGEL